MDISTLCKDYFNGFKEISTPRSSPGTKILAALKILSYITLIVPLGFAIASLFGRISSNPPRRLFIYHKSYSKSLFKEL